MTTKDRRLTFDEQFAAATTVPAARMARGRWSDEQGRTVGEGDISASYSADQIGMSDRVRRPFRFRGQGYVVTSKTSQCRKEIAKAFRLVAADDFPEATTTYQERSAEGLHEAARENPLGFYHGLSVQHSKRDCVLVGPPLLLRPDDKPQEEQLDLF